MRKWLILGLLCLLGATAQATTYYVDNCVVVGSDSNSGTSPSTPWLTAGVVYTKSFNPGDTILFQGGCNWRMDSFTVSNGNLAILQVNSAGSSGSPITIGGYGTGNPTITGSQLVSGTWYRYSSGVEDGAGTGTTSPSGTALDSGGLTTSNASDLIAGFLWTSTGSGLSTSGTNLTLREGTRFTSTVYEGYSGDYDVAATGSYHATGTSNASSFWGAQVAAFIASGTPTWVQGKAYTGFTAVPGPVTISFPTNNTAGNFIACNIGLTHSFTSIVLTDGNGNNYFPATPQVVQVSTITSRMYFAANIAGGANTVTLSWSGGTVAPYFTCDEYSGVAPGVLQNIWALPFTPATGLSIPAAVYFNGVAGTYVSTVAGITAAGDWTYSPPYLYVYSTTNPATAFTNPGIEAGMFYGFRNLQSYITVENMTFNEAGEYNIFVGGNSGGGNNTIMSGLTVTNNASTNSTDGTGKGVVIDGANNVQFLNGTVENILGGHGLVVYSATGFPVSGITVTGNQFYNLGGQGIGGDQIPGNTIGNAVAKNNTFSYVGWNPALVSSPCASWENATGAGNVIAYNSCWFSGYQPNGTAGYMSRGFGTDVISSTYGSNVVIAYNVAVGSSGACLFNAGPTNFFYNNTCYGNVANCGAGGSPHCGGEGMMTFYSDAGSSTIKNNVFANTLPSMLFATAVSSTGNAWDYDNWSGGAAQSGNGPWYNDGTNYLTFSAWQAASFTPDAHGSYANPQLTNPTAAVAGSPLPPVGAFYPLMTSPTIGGGTSVGLTTDYFGIPIIPGFVSQGAIQFQPRPGVGSF